MDAKCIAIHLQYLFGKCSRRDDTLSQWRFVAAFQYWNISDNDSEQKNLAMSRQMKRQSSTDEPKAGPSVKKISKMSQKMPEGTKLIASSPHSNCNISDNDSEQEYLAMSSK
ncbi:hypothetical protein DAPPUDRAFT_250327 [Daphnia pulex]|uniref:Uncharacterized protein n=1 Tax=Daphnia pulex TaxID=6669 RepID=E9GYB7_DAPPU|nr:hypothetical protein DAPPUDRAFT_250327 [Daphnia pulex]|eukprot:EFX75591.1 hypothetical protein DAPPUDRAFT_250327 [Daphnia pulex]